MMKMELNEVLILLQIMEVNQFQGKDIPVIAKLMEKLQKEAIKLQPKEAGSF